MRRRLAWIVPGLLAASIACCSSCATFVRPRADLVPAEPPSAFGYDDWQATLASHVSDSGRVDYATLATEREPLERFFAQLSAVSPESHPELFADEAARLAYWINAYNASVMRLVLASYPIDSVKDVKAPFWAFFLPRGAGFFYFRKVLLGHAKHHLYGVENDIVRERFADPRIHFALNCASIGCPELPAEPFLPEQLEAQLDRETRAFFAEPRNLRLDDATKTIWLSSILDWYASDFTDWLEANAPGSPATLVEYAARYAPAETAVRLRGDAAGWTVAFESYDWALNDAGRTTR